MAEPLKTLYNPALVRTMAQHLARAAGALGESFDAAGFAAAALDGLEDRELMARAELISDALETHLPDDFPRAAALLRAALHPGAAPDGGAAPPDDALGLRGWAIVPMGRFVSRCGMGHIDLGLETLRDFTSRLTSEFALRPFYLADPETTLAHARRWAQDPDPHVRRLASEGLRPRLPWGLRLKPLVEDPAPILPILTTLRDDPSDYVRRSVANALNDIAKDHPDLVAGIVADWLDGASSERAALLRHAARTLIKAGHEGALASFGYGAADLAEVTVSVTPDAVRMGEALEITVTLTARGPAAQPVLLDYVVHFQRADGRLSPKVFKWTKATLEPGVQRVFRKRHPLREVTTRRHYPGAHRVSVQVNGAIVGAVDVTLLG